MKFFWALSKKALEEKGESPIFAATSKFSGCVGGEIGRRTTLRW